MCYTCSEIEDKVGDYLTGNDITNIIYLQGTYIYIFLVCCSCAQADILQMRREEGKKKKKKFLMFRAAIAVVIYVTKPSFESIKAPINLRLPILDTKSIRVKIPPSATYPLS